MSLTNVRKYFRDRLDSIGLKEWPEGFELANNPDTVLDRSYHLMSGSITQNQQNQTVIDLLSPVEIKILLKGFRDNASAIDESISLGEQILCECVSAVNANNLSIKDVQFQNMETQPWDESNDKIIVLIMLFEARVLLNPN